MQIQIVSGHGFIESNHIYNDESIAPFLKRMDEQGFFDNTIVQLYADHGDHIHLLLEYSPSGMVEKTHPPLFMIVPEHISEKYGENLEWNQDKLISHYNIF